MTTDVLAYIADGGWHDTDLIAAGVGITNRSVAQQMRRHVAAGTVERSGAKPFSYRLAATDREAFPVVVAAPPPTAEVEPVDAPPIAWFAIWDDGSITISRDSDAMYLSPDEVARLNAHMARFR
jgi:hypothetical protein